MARPLRIEYPGAFYHVTSRGNERGTVFQGNRDGGKYLSYLVLNRLMSDMEPLSIHTGNVGDRYGGRREILKALIALVKTFYNGKRRILTPVDFENLRRAA